MPATVFTEAEVRAACRTFATSTSCPDSLPMSLVGQLSPPLLRALAAIMATTVAFDGA